MYPRWLHVGFTLCFFLTKLKVRLKNAKEKKVYGSWKTFKVVEYHHIILQACKFMEFGGESYRDMGNFLKLNFGEQLSKRTSWINFFTLIGATLSFACENFKSSLKGHWKSWNFMIFKRMWILNPCFCFYWK